jgi:hypothetical protein
MKKPLNIRIWNTVFKNEEPLVTEVYKFEFLEARVN